MLFVIGKEEGCHQRDVLLDGLSIDAGCGRVSRLHRGSEEIVDSSAHKIVVIRHFPGREATVGKGMVGGGAKVFYGVEKSSVKVEYCEFCHLPIIFLDCTSTQE